MKKYWPCFLLLFLLTIRTDSGAQIITTFAGNGAYGSSGDGGPALMAETGEPCRLVFDNRGNLFLAGQTVCNIRKIDPSGVITTVAGTGTPGYGGDGGPATAAQLYWPEGVAVDNAGNIFIADQFNDRVRKVDTNGIISTIAGVGTPGYSGDGGPATAAHLWHPSSIGLDCAGNIYFTDQDNSAVRKISTAGIVTTVAGDGSAGFSGDGGPASASKLNFPEALTVDCAGNIYISDLYNERIRKINTSGIITTVAGGGTGGIGDGGPATAAFIWDASAVCLDRSGNIYIGDLYHYTVRKVSTSGIITTIAGNDTSGYSGDCDTATKARLSFIQGLAADTAGNIYLSDFNNSRVRKVSGLACFPTGIAVPPAPQLCDLFPNPSAGQFTLRINGNETMRRIEIFNATGQKICSYDNISGEYAIDMRDQPAGIYFLHLRSGKVSNVRKLAVER